MGRDVPDAEVEAAARAAAIHDVILTFPDGYKTLVGEKGVTLSGGQRQRVAIARTLLKDPRILILDDSTSSVDTETEAEIRTALERLMQGRTTFIIAHRIQSLMNADLILVLDGGRVVQHGTHDELMAQEGMYRQIYDLQAKIEDELTQELSGDRSQETGVRSQGQETDDRSLHLITEGGHSGGSECDRIAGVSERLRLGHAHLRGFETLPTGGAVCLDRPDQTIVEVSLHEPAGSVGQAAI